MTDQLKPLTHGSFTIERTYPHAPAKVFAAHSDLAKKRRWFAEGEGFTVLEYEMDFRVGGREWCLFRFGEGPEMYNDTRYELIDQDRRIVFSYRMGIGDAPFSASLSSIELTPVDGGTRLTLTEQGVYLWGEDDVRGREHGCRELLERLAAELDL